MQNIEFKYEFDPVKENVGGKKAEKVIWTTKALEKAVAALKAGLPLKSNPFCGQNTKLLKPELVYERTADEITEYIKCKKDPVYFAGKCFIKQPTGLEPCVLRDYQEDYLRHLQKHRFSIMLAARQIGKSLTTAIYCLWVILFNNDKSGLILSKSGPAGRDLLSKIKDMFLYLPYYLKCGTYKWNQSEISFDNNSNITTEPFSPTAGLGKTINFLILDEFAWCPPGDVDMFYTNIVPTITTDPTANVCIMSTQNGFNLFYKLYKAAVEGKNIYAPFKVDWWQVPNWNPQTRTWEKRTEEWKQQMIGVLGSEEAFYYQYGTQFSISDRCIVSREALSKIHISERLFTPRQNDMAAAGLDIYLQHPDKLYLDPDYDLENFKKNKYIILADLAEGGGGDDTVFNILECQPKKYIQVGYWKDNKTDLEHTALEWWLLVCQLFNTGNAMLSIEWNTYGALFYKYIKDLNNNDEYPEYSFRYNIKGTADGVDMDNIVKYKKETIEKSAADGPGSIAKYIPGIRLTTANKHVACSMLKMYLEKGVIEIHDITTIGQIENFEDANGNGSYAAKNGHDDIIMTLCQIPMMEQSMKFKDFKEEPLYNQAAPQEDSIYGGNIGSSVGSLYGAPVDGWGWSGDAARRML